MIKKGTVKVGMKMRPKGSVIDLVPITGVELVDSVGEKRDSAVALCATYRDATELKGLQSLFGEGSVLEVED
ncbi:MAG: hypothetical protein R3F07_19680 [Opitutaceae bacterium]